MKLYFYFLDTIKSEIRMEECEVKEKKWEYKILGFAPFGYIGKTVDKSAIGNIGMTFLYYMVLKEKDAERVAKEFASVCKGDIRYAEKTIKSYEKMIDRYRETIENIEKWRSENAEK